MSFSRSILTGPAHWRKALRPTPPPPPRGMRAGLRIDRPQRGMSVDHDLVRSQRDERATAHRVVRHHRDDAAIVVMQRPRDLAGRQYESARRVQDDFDPLARWRPPDTTQHALGVI